MTWPGMGEWEVGAEASGQNAAGESDDGAEKKKKTRGGFG